MPIMETLGARMRAVRDGVRRRFGGADLKTGSRAASTVSTRGRVIGGW